MIWIGYNDAVCNISTYPLPGVLEGLTHRLALVNPAEKRQSCKHHE